MLVGDYLDDKFLEFGIKNLGQLNFSWFWK